MPFCVPSLPPPPAAHYPPECLLPSPSVSVVDDFDDKQYEAHVRRNLLNTVASNIAIRKAAATRQ